MHNTRRTKRKWRCQLAAISDVCTLLC